MIGKCFKVIEEYNGVKTNAANVVRVRTIFSLKSAVISGPSNSDPGHALGFMQKK